MNIPGYDQNPPDMQGGDQMQGDPNADQQSQGDGLHHHQIDQDEGGGFHSVHTFPDGHQEQADHVDYDEAKSKQDADFGCGPDDAGDGEDGGDDGDTSFADDGEDSGMDNVAASYGNKASKG